jgi:glycosyltransferase involved in cell wall biosynthesis
MSPASNPLVTVLIPIFKSERYVRVALESILAQTYAHFEIILVCDVPPGSTDRSLEIIDSFADSRIRKIVNVQKQGLIGSLNQGIAEARGELIARMDSDDCCFPNRLEEQVAEMIRNPDLDFLGCGFQCIDSKGRPVGRPYIQPGSHELIAWGLCTFNPMVHPAMMMRKSALQRLQGYSREAHSSEDYDLWCRAALARRLGNVGKILLQLRKHPENNNTLFLHDTIIKADEVNRRYLAAYLNKPAIEIVPQLVTSPAARTGKELRLVLQTLWHVYRAGMQKTAGRPADTRWILGVTLKRALQHLLRSLATRLQSS